MKTQAELNKYYSINLELQIKFKSLGHRKGEKKYFWSLYRLTHFNAEESQQSAKRKVGIKTTLQKFLSLALKY